MKIIDIRKEKIEEDKFKITLFLHVESGEIDRGMLTILSKDQILSDWPLEYLVTEEVTKDGYSAAIIENELTEILAVGTNHFACSLIYTGYR